MNKNNDFSIYNYIKDFDIKADFTYHTLLIHNAIYTLTGISGLKYVFPSDILNHLKTKENYQHLDIDYIKKIFIYLRATCSFSLCTDGDFFGISPIENTDYYVNNPNKQ